MIIAHSQGLAATTPVATFYCMLRIMVLALCKILAAAEEVCDTADREYPLGIMGIAFKCADTN